jgi:ribose transport system ATP-binding protein
MRDLRSGTGLIILDESTRALGGDDLVRVHALLRRITAEGSSAVMISHNLTELTAVTDRMTVLRDGRLAASGVPTAELTEHDIARYMLGGAVAELHERVPAAPAELPPAVTVTGLSGRRVEDVNFTVGAGEILGITGLPGNGYEDIPYLLAGAQSARTGQVETAGGRADLRRAGVGGCMRKGIVLVPERRDRDGLAFELNVRDNISLPSLRTRGRPWFVARRWQQESAEQAVETLGIRPNTPSILVKQLSGGNQQKVLLAKWLGVGPRLLILHEPTQAVDVGARQDILRALQQAARSGVSVLLVSSEPEDLVAVCDRVLVYEPGRGVRRATSATPERLIEEIYGTTEAAGRPT